MRGGVVNDRSPSLPVSPAPPSQNGHISADEAFMSGDPLEYVSVSRLKSFLGCRLKFYFEKVLAKKRPTSPNLHYGKAIHACIQHYNKARWRGGNASEAAVVAV
jgi:putative RecB family exonuclease